MRTDRRRDIEIARAVAIILVVIGHYFPDGSPSWYATLRDWAYSFHMPLFMFLSGYVYILSRREESYFSFVRRKARRLLVPYLAVSAIIILIKLVSQYVLGMDIKNPVGLDETYKVFTEPYAAVHFWFIFALWWMFMLVPLFKTRASRVCLLFVAAALHYLPEYTQVTWPSIFCLDYSADYFLYFMIGVVMSDYGLRLADAGVPACVTVLLLFILNSVYRPFPAVDAYVGILGIMALSELLSRLPAPMQRPLLAVSDSSYVIYLTHSIFIGFATTALKAVPPLCDISSGLFWLGAALVVTVSVVCSMLLHPCFGRLQRVSRIF